MAVSGVTGSGASTAAQVSTEKALNELNFETFLKLITTQLKYQDPLNPQDNTQFLGQLAQFGGLQQQIQTNELLAKLNEQRDLGQQSLATSYLGRAVLAPGESFKKTDDGTVPFGYALEENAREMRIEIYNSTGAVVRTMDTIDAKAVAAGSHTFNWDGKTDAGEYAANDTYKVRITAYNDEGVKVVSQLLTYGVALAVNTGDTGDVSLELADGRNVAFEDISQVVVSVN